MGFCASDAGSIPARYCAYRTLRALGVYNRKASLFTFDHGLFYCEEASFNYAFFLLSTSLLTQVSHIQFSYLPIDILLTDWLWLPWLEKEIEMIGPPECWRWVLVVFPRGKQRPSRTPISWSYHFDTASLEEAFSSFHLPSTQDDRTRKRRDPREKDDSYVCSFLDSIPGREYRICSFFLCSSASAFEHTCKGRVSCKQEARKKGIEPITNSNWGWKENCPANTHRKNQQRLFVTAALIYS